jgi:hypothetical protein
MNILNWFRRSKVHTQDFIQWRESHPVNPCREELEQFGECQHGEEQATKVERALHVAYHQMKEDEKNSPLGEESYFRSLPITVLNYRTYDECGWTVEIGRHTAEAKRNQIHLNLPRFPQSIPTKQVRYQDTFEKIFAEAVAANHYIELADEPTKLRYGFVVYRMSGIVRYTIRRSDYGMPNREELTMMGFEPETDDKELLNEEKT